MMNFVNGFEMNGMIGGFGWANSVEEMFEMMNKVKKEFEEKRERDLYEEMINYMVDYEIATEDEIRLVTDVCGMSIETLDKIVEVRTGYNSLDDYMCDYDEDDDDDEEYDDDEDEDYDDEDDNLSEDDIRAIRNILNHYFGD